MTEVPSPVYTILSDGSAVVAIGNLSEPVSNEGLEVDADIVHRIAKTETKLRERWLVENTAEAD
tara:strand:+ start:60 stop:251 length:192 start_codon:yes stop_codon:yes gene_type:complete